MKNCTPALVKLILGLLVLVGSFTTSLAQVKYVKPVATGTGDGSSWTNASGNLPAMISAAGINGQIWVAKGTYYPTSTNDRSISFVMKNGLTIYGGFAGTETQLNQRSIKNNPTILSGDINTASNRFDNSYHVVSCNGLNNTAVLDGFTIRVGFANGSGADISGAGIRIVNSTAKFINCSFFDNTSTGQGGAIFNSSSSPRFENCIFANNTAGYNGTSSGGAIYNTGSSPSIINCSFTTNTATNGNGGGIYNISSSSPTITNTIIWDNSPDELYNSGATSSPIVSYSIIKGGYAGTANLNTDPLFVDAAHANLRLQACSPAINNGLTTARSQFFDLDSYERVVGGTIDRGSYEFQDDPASKIIYVNAAATGANSGRSWANAYTKLQDALTDACPGITQVWVASGFYYPDEGIGKTSKDRNAAFKMRTNLAIYGGFAGNETTLDQRDWNTNTTTLSGDIGIKDNNTDNSYHIIYNDNPGVALEKSAVLDGFTITSGNANGAANNAKYGGGLYNYNSSPSITNCIFINNISTLGGGGIYNATSLPVITNCGFFSNRVTGTDGYGAGMYNNNSSPSITNCIFTKNSASGSGGDGGAMYNNASSSPTIINCSFTGNSASSGGGIANGNLGATIIKNSILWNNSPNEMSNNGTPAITYSIVKGGYTGTGNLDKDPLFEDATSSNLRLQAGSPAINTGLNIANTQVRDFYGNPRIVGGIIDMGAYESQVICPAGNKLYVKEGAAAGGDGSSWAKAYASLQDALAHACVNVTQIWVAKGTYYPDEGVDYIDNDRNASYKMRNNLAIYGGFAGTETADFDLTQRNFATNTTILSGDIDKNRVRDDGNSYHVVFNNNNSLDASSMLDGFTITAGNANGEDPNQSGGGMYNANSSPSITNCSFTGNSAYDGGGMYNGNGSAPRITNCSFSANTASSGGGTYNIGSSPTITNCNFTGNSTDLLGGGMNNERSSPTITNCSFTGNSTGYGGGMHNFNNSSLSVTNCRFSDNNATVEGGGMHNEQNSSAKITNCSFTRNSAAIFGGGMYNHRTSPIITNCIIWGNSGGQMYNINFSTPAITYSIIQGGYAGTGNLDVNPLFVDASNGDLHLQAGSPAINTGLNPANTQPTDLDGNPRIVNGTIDRGAYEVPAVCPSSGILYVAADAAPGGDGSSWVKAFTKLQDALSNTCPGITQIWVANGTYYPDEGGGKADNDRNASYKMRNNLAIYGGFAGTEAANFDLTQRNFAAHPTILSGDIDKNRVRDDGNSYHVVFNNNNNLDASSILDGFTITGGNANEPDPNQSGGGMYNYNSSPSIANCVFTGNSATSSGGGMHNYNSSPSIANCVFTGNSATSYGGGMYNYLSSPPAITNCSFTGNSANSGGGICNFNNSSPTITNCSFTGNSAGNQGGGIYITNSSFPSITNCSISNNSATGSNGGGVYTSASSVPSITNCIIWGNIGVQIFGGNPTLTYSIVQGGYTGTGNLDKNPLFVDAANGNLRLQACSPAINVGSDPANSTAIDLDGNPRKVGIIDMGAYERQTAIPSTWYLDITATGSGDGSSWANAFTSLSTALQQFNACSVGNTLLIAKGTYTGTPPFEFDKLDATILGGYPSGGGTRNPANNPVIIEGDIKVLQSLRIDGVKVQKP